MTDGYLMFVGRRQYEMLMELGGFPRNPQLRYCKSQGRGFCQTGAMFWPRAWKIEAARLRVGSWIAGVDLDER